MSQKVTIATVARRAGVSRQTVSNVLNAPHLVRPQTRQRVQEAISILGYRANQAARQMRTGRSRLIAVRIEPTRDGINGSVLDRFLHGLTESAAAAAYRILLYTAADVRAEISTFDELLGAYELDAFVLTSTDHGDARASWLAERKVPFVTFGRPWDDSGQPHRWVDVDNASGTAQATRHLLNTGHRRIAFLGWPVGSGVGDDRRHGWLSELRAARISPAGLDWQTQDGVAEGARAAERMLALAEPPTACVCASDSLALGALQMTRVLGWSMAVTGFDDTPVAAAVGLTSVSQPLAEAASSCVELLTGALDGRPDQMPRQVLLEPALIRRRSA